MEPKECVFAASVRQAQARAARRRGAMEGRAARRPEAMPSDLSHK